MTASRSSLALAALLLAACGGGHPASTSATAASAKTDSACATRSPDTVAEYQRKLTTFKATEGFAMALAPQQVLEDQQELALTVTEAGFSDGLGFSMSYLRDCAVFPMGDGNFYDQGNGRWTMTLHTGTGSDVPDGLPASLEVRRTQLIPNPNGGMPSAKTTVVGEYAIRINNPKR